ncbi:MAG: YncE family protein [Deltaproteobacteria bacterium]|nr:YncE family protein [Deltaproteobacteria bacterium]
MYARTTLAVTALLAAATACVTNEEPPPPGGTAARRIVVAIEEESAVAVLSEEDGAVIGEVSLADGDQLYDVHNVQGDPDGRTAWATAMPMEEGGMSMADELLVGIDTVELTVTKRIALGAMLHVAHVVTDGDMAWVNAKDSNEVIEVDLEAGEVMRRIALPEGTGPHGVRRTPDGTRLILAGWDGQSLAVVDLASGEVTSHDVGGIGVQAAVLPDGSAAFVTVYDTKQVARLDLATDELTLIDLPAGSAGPVQIYPTPDSSGVWVADQGFVNGDPAGESLYLLDASTGAVRTTATVSPAPHGVVTSEDGSVVWTTTLVGGTVDRVDAATGERLSSTPVGEGPNGITCFHDGGAMP